MTPFEPFERSGPMEQLCWRCCRRRADPSSPLATAGTGDVLSGAIGALLSKRLHPFRAACAGTWLHATAGQVAAERLGADVVIARDVIEALPEARRRR